MGDFSLPTPPHPPYYNVLRNGGMWLAQRQAPGTLTSLGTTDAYGADCWKVAVENADVQYQRSANASGLTASHFGTWKKITSTGKVVVYQPVENVDTLPYCVGGRRVTFQCQLKASASKTLRMGILELGSGGTADTIPAAIVPTTWGATSTDPTWATNVAVAGSAVSCAATTSWAKFNVSATLTTTAKNLILAVWTDAGFAANDTFSMTEAQLVDGAVPLPWLPADFGVEVARCQRFYEKSFELDTLPGTATATGAFDIQMAAATTGRFTCPVRFAVPKRVAPVAATQIRLWDSSGNGGLSDGTNGKVLKGAANKIGTAVQPSQAGMNVTTADTTSAAEFLFHYSVDVGL